MRLNVESCAVHRLQFVFSGADAGAGKLATMDAGATPGITARKQYAGATASMSGGTFQHYDIADSRARIARAAPQINQCYAATEFEPPDHQFMGWSLAVNPQGIVTDVRPKTDYKRHAKLDACMAAALRTIRWAETPSVPMAA